MTDYLKIIKIIFTNNIYYFILLNQRDAIKDSNTLLKYAYYLLALRVSTQKVDITIIAK